MGSLGDIPLASIDAVVPNLGNNPLKNSTGLSVMRLFSQAINKELYLEQKNIYIK